MARTNPPGSLDLASTPGDHLANPTIQRQADTLAHVADALLCICDVEPLAADLEKLHGAARRLYRCACRSQGDDLDHGDVADAIGSVRSVFSSVKERMDVQSEANWRSQIAWRDVEDCCRRLTCRSRQVPDHLRDVSSPHCDGKTK